jgi:hypothetical protein
LHLAVYSIVFRPGPVQGSGFDRVARVKFFFLNQNDVVLVKRNKSQRVATRFLTKSCRVTPGFFFPYFFFNPARF